MSSEKSQSPIGRKIDVIDATPNRWKAAGIVSALGAMYPMFFGVPSELPIPLVVVPITEVMFPSRDPVAAAIVALPVFLVIGIYAGHVFHKIFEEDLND